jgi:hypothetical protein
MRFAAFHCENFAAIWISLSQQKFLDPSQKNSSQSVGAKYSFCDGQVYSWPQRANDVRLFNHALYPNSMVYTACQYTEIFLIKAASAHEADPRAVK